MSLSSCDHNIATLETSADNSATSKALCQYAAPSCWGRIASYLIAPICDEVVHIKDMGILHHLHFEGRQAVDPKGERWALVAKHQPSRIATGSLLRLTYRPSRSTLMATSFTGVLLGVRRSSGDPTIIVRGVIDGVGVEQIFCVFSPLLEKIDVLKAAPGKSTRKLYRLREHPAEILKLQKAAAEQASQIVPVSTPIPQRSKAISRNKKNC